ncbi:energy transducer TonB [Cystobacter ferrugineus]|uniref:Energy transducer TonB n=2 Tax=Cystobacter ferrugineus TaxID=83449 RepID=A0A1L9B6X9_9BACT|nr:energy transducer TonB [Cystobacter ferrugineus]
MSTGPSHPEQPSRRRRRREHPARYLLAMLLALLLQGAFVGLLALMAYIQVNLPPEPKSKPPSAVALRPMTSQEWEKNRGPLAKTPATAKAPPPKKEEKKPEKRPDGQVVDVAPGNRQEAPDAKYLAEHDNKVQKETRAREQTAHYKTAQPQTTAREARQGSGVSEEQAGHVAGNNGRGADDRPLSEGGKKSAFELPDARRKQEIAMRQDPNNRGPGVEVSNRNESDEVIGNAKRLRLQEGSGDGDEGSEGRVGTSGLARLMPSQAVMDQIIGGAPNDHLRDVEEGDGTFLNTREWKYASFFNRVKQSVGTHWNPNMALMRRDPTGATYAGRDRHTLVRVTLDEQGKVADITIEKSCGLDFLDMEAVESFRRAQPFPNPPPGLLEDDAKVRFSFGFFMDMGGGPRMRLFRQPN